MFVSRKTFGALTVAALAAATSALAASAVLQPLDYTDQLQSFYNPDRGFYRPQVIHFRPETIEVEPYYKNRLMHLRAEISAFSSNAVWDTSDPTAHGTTQDLTEAMLNSFRAYLDKIRATNSTVIVVFPTTPGTTARATWNPRKSGF